MKACDVMRRAVVSLPQNAALKEVIRTFVKNQIDSLPVVDAAERVVGFIVLDRLADLFLPRYAEILRDYAALEDKGQLAPLFENAFSGLDRAQENLIVAADLMNSRLDWVTTEDSLIQAASRLRSQRLERLPVVDRDRKLVGLISECAVILALLYGTR